MCGKHTYGAVFETASHLKYKRKTLKAAEWSVTSNVQVRLTKSEERKGTFTVAGQRFSFYKTPSVSMKNAFSPKLRAANTKLEGGKLLDAFIQQDSDHYLDEF